MDSGDVLKRLNQSIVKEIAALQNQSGWRGGTETMAPLPTVVVKTARSRTIGFLYFKTSTHVVLLNHLLQATDLGPLKGVVDGHYSHEVDITIIPATDVTAIDVFKVPE